MHNPNAHSVTIILLIIITYFDKTFNLPSVNIATISTTPQTVYIFLLESNKVFHKCMVQ